MPPERRFIWQRIAACGYGDTATVERVIIAAVLELLANAAAHFESVLRRHCHVTSIEEAVQVAAQ